MAELGSDFDTPQGLDLTPELRRVSGRTAFLQAIARRLRTPRGGLFYAPDYGTDIRSLLSTATTPRAIEQAITAEVLKDERTESCTARITTDDSGVTEIRIDVVDADGPFSLTIDPADLTLELLNGGA